MRNAKPVGGVQEPQRFLIPARPLVQERQLTRRLCFAQDRAGAHSHRHRIAEPRFRQRVPSGLPVDSPDHLVGVGLVQTGVEPVEDPQRGLGVQTRVVVTLPGKMDFGVIQEPETLEMDIPDCLGDVEALAEILVGVVPQLAVRTHHAEIVVGDSASAVITDALEGHERLAIVRQRFGQRTLDVGQDPEVLFGAPPELGAGYAQLERLVKLLSRLRDEASLEVEARKRIQCFCGKDRVTDVGRGLVASLAQLAGDCGLVT